MAHPTAQSQTRLARLGSLKLGWQLSRRCLGVGVLLLAMEAPVLAHLTEAIELSAEETELIDALTEPSVSNPAPKVKTEPAISTPETFSTPGTSSTAEAEPLSPESEAVTNEAMDALADSMADAVADEGVVKEVVVETQEQDSGIADDANSLSGDAEAIVEVEAATELDAQGVEAAEVVEASPTAEPAVAELEAEAENSDDAIAEESPEVDLEAEPTLAEGEETLEEELAEGEIEAPIPTLAERCAAPEATLFPPEPEASDEAEESTEADAPEGTAVAETSTEEESDDTTTAKAREAESSADDLVPPAATAEEETEEATAEASEPDASIAESETEAATAQEEAAEEVAIVEPDTDLDDLDKEAEAEAAAKAAQEKELVCALYQADQQYQAGQLALAKAGYQLAKDPFAAEAKAIGLERKPAITDPAELSPGGRVFLRESAAGREQNLATRILVPLELLTQQHPEFIPGQVQLAEALVDADRADEALTLLEEATGRYPNEPSLLKAHIELAGQQGEWMDAVMQARRFAQLNPDHPEAEAFVALAEENMVLYQREVRDRLRANTVANVLTGAVSVALTGSIWNSLSSIQTTAMMLRGEEGVGNGISKSIKRQVELVEDEEVVNYVQAMGEELVAVAGRDEFDYEFNLLMDPNLNAFALPGGKIFVNAGAIAKTRSKAELAGLLSHELAHAVLSHGFRLVSDGSLLSDLSRFVPYGGYASNLVVLNYSRDMEREADELGARILSASGYAADGLHGLMKTLGEQDTRKPLFAWMSTHPETDERVGNLEEQISKEGLERYQFEGVEEHFRMRIKVMRLIEEWKERKAKEEEERPWWR